MPIDVSRGCLCQERIRCASRGEEVAGDIDSEDVAAIAGEERLVIKCAGGGPVFAGSHHARPVTNKRERLATAEPHHVPWPVSEYPGDPMN